MAVNLLRYPGGKQRFLKDLAKFLPPRSAIRGRYVEPFIGGAAVFFFVEPKAALLSDINSDLIDLFEGIKQYPLEVWNIYRSFPATKQSYYQIRDLEIRDLNLAERSARLLYLNRTCFKGMWRHNAEGRFNVGYGGEERRWVIDCTLLLRLSERLSKADLRTSDFEPIIDECTDNDFLFLDPPYKPGSRELRESHYVYAKFPFDEYRRLAQALSRATERGTKWVMTISSHIEILGLFAEEHIVPLQKGVGKMPGLVQQDSGEVLISNRV